MKIRLRELRSIIKSIVLEKAVTTRAANKAGLALYVHKNKNDGDTYYVLYDADAIIEEVEKIDVDTEIEDDTWHPHDILTRQKKVVYNSAWSADGGSWFFNNVVREHTYGIIDVHKPVGKQPKSWGASVVARSAAKHGYGPLMYDIAMYLEGGLISDRDSVSQKAQSVWRHYKENRPDVEHKLLDDFEAPKTKTKFDDADVYRKPGKLTRSKGIETWEDDEIDEDDPRNYAYFIDHVDGLEEMLQRSNEFVQEMEEAAPEIDVDKLMSSSLDAMFDRLYR